MTGAVRLRYEDTTMSPSIRALLQGPLPVTAPLVLNPLMARMVEAGGFPAGYLGGGSTGWAARRRSCGNRKAPVMRQPQSAGHTARKPPSTTTSVPVM